MVSTAQALVARYQDLGERINQIYDGVNSQISTAVSSINSYATQIASLNQSIVVAGSANSQPPNDLLDQRDQLVLEMNKLIKVSTTSNTDGTYNVYIGNGQQLVTGAQVNGLTALPSVADPSRVAVGLKTAGGSQELPESLITGGSLGGLINFRSETLDRVAGDLGRNAASLALTFNAQNALGQDLQGNIAGGANFVGNFFNVPTPKVVASTLNTVTNPTVSVAYTSPPPFNGNFYTDLTNSDYRLDYNGANLTLTRLSDNTQWSGATVAALNVVLAQPGNAQGFSLNPAVFVAGDAGASYLIQPTRTAASDISVNAAVAADPRLLAAAAPIRTQAASSNTGGAAISPGTVATGYTAPAAGSPITLAYNAGAFTGFPAGVVSVTSGGTTTNYTYPAPDASIPYTNGATITFSGISVQISGAPDNGDTFTVARNSGAVSDGRNALALGQLQTQNTMSGMSASYQSAYAQLVSDVGNKARETDVRSTAQTALLKESTDARDSLSGVNLDEEAGNLMRYQQAYQASAKMMDIGNKLFDTLLASMS
jgi:flagellar hook-associated protein 1 FlgK